MESVKVRIKGSVVTNRFGALSTGDVIATDEAYAKHLVDAGAAEYERRAEQPAPAETPPAQEPDADEDTEDEEIPGGSRPVPQPSRRRKAE